MKIREFLLKHNIIKSKYIQDVRKYINDTEITDATHYKFSRSLPANAEGAGADAEYSDDVDYSRVSTGKPTTDEGTKKKISDGPKFSREPVESGAKLSKELQIPTPDNEIKYGKKLCFSRDIRMKQN